MSAAHLTDTQERIVELALDNLDNIHGESRAAVDYALEQLFYGTSPEYHSERAAREPGDVVFLIDAIKARLRKIADLAGPPPPSRTRRWEVEA